MNKDETVNQILEILEISTRPGPLTEAELRKALELAFAKGQLFEAESQLARLEKRLAG